MMHHPDLDLMIETERRKDEIRAAEHSRLVKQARGEFQLRLTYRTAALTLSRALAFLGERLLDWSARLQCRYHMLAVSQESQPEPCA
jgi:hypothetical protein